MATVIVIAFGVVVLAGLAAVFRPSHNGDSTIEFNGIAFKSAVSGVFLVVVGFGAVFIRPKWFDGSDSAPVAKKPKPSAAVAAAPRSRLDPLSRRRQAGPIGS